MQLALRISLFALSMCSISFGAPAITDINTIMMRSTFKIEGGGTFGTAFFVGKPTKADPAQSSYVLVTAAHVLNTIKGETATLFLRKKDGVGFVKLPVGVSIRNGVTPLWTQHPKADVAVMHLPVPRDADILLIGDVLVATDTDVETWEIHPGDRLACLGYPLGTESNTAGFPVLRSGYVASYPLTPAKNIGSYLFDFAVFNGNSGGPVYFVDTNRMYAGQTHLGETVQLLVGLVTASASVDEKIESISEIRVQRHSLGLATVVPAALIRETLDLLPEVTK